MGGGLALQHWVREPSGIFCSRRVDGDAVWSESFGTFIVRVETPDGVRLRLADSIDPLQLIPSPDERAAIRELRAEQSRVAAERARADAERYRALLRQHGIEPD